VESSTRKQKATLRRRNSLDAYAASEKRGATLFNDDSFSRSFSSFCHRSFSSSFRDANWEDNDSDTTGESLKDVPTFKALKPLEKLMRQASFGSSSSTSFRKRTATRNHKDDDTSDGRPQDVPTFKALSPLGKLIRGSSLGSSTSKAYSKAKKIMTRSNSVGGDFCEEALLDRQSIQQIPL